LNLSLGAKRLLKRNMPPYAMTLAEVADQRRHVALELCLIAWCVIPLLLHNIAGPVIPQDSVPFTLVRAVNAILVLVALWASPVLFLATSAPRRVMRFLREERTTALALALLVVGGLWLRLSVVRTAPLDHPAAAEIMRHGRGFDLLGTNVPDAVYGRALWHRLHFVLLGASVPVLLCLNAVSGALLTLVAYSLCRFLLGGPHAPMAGATLFTLAPTYLLASTTEAFTAPLLLVSITALVFFLRRDRRPRTLALSLALLLLAVEVRPDHIAMVPAFFIAFLVYWQGGTGRTVPILIVAFLLATLPHLVLVAYQEDVLDRGATGSAIGRLAAMVRSHVPSYILLLALAGAVDLSDRRPKALILLGGWALAFALAYMFLFTTVLEREPLGTLPVLLLPLMVLAAQGIAVLFSWSIRFHPRAPGVMAFAVILVLSWELVKTGRAFHEQRVGDPQYIEYRALLQRGTVDPRCSVIVNGPHVLAPYMLSFRGEPREVADRGELIWALNDLVPSGCWYYYNGLPPDDDLRSDMEQTYDLKNIRKLLGVHGFTEVPGTDEPALGDDVFLYKREALPA